MTWTAVLHALFLSVPLALRMWSSGRLQLAKVPLPPTRHTRMMSSVNSSPVRLVLFDVFG